MNGFIAGMLAAGLLAGCAAQAPRPHVQAVPTEPPVCSNSTECERMWIGARETLQNLTGLRLRIATDSLLETFPPSNRRITAGSVSKSPLGDGRYEIRMRMECYYSDCTNLRISGENAFNSTMKMYSDLPAK